MLEMLLAMNVFLPTAAAVATPAAVPAQESPPAAAAPRSIMNPALSVIGWFQAVAGNDADAQERAFELREAEVSLQSQVDPFARADFFLAFGPEGIEIEEGYLTWLALPGGGQARLGKLRSDFGKFNRTHPPETPFADRPLATVALLGEEGLALTGVGLSAVIPNPLDLYWDVVANLGAIPDESALFDAGSRSDLLAVGRSSAFLPLGESADVHLGVSYANALAREDLRSEGNRAQLGWADLTFRWKNPRRSIYRSLLVQGEYGVAQGSAADAPRRSGGFGYVIYQFARQWRAGARWDWTERPGTDAHESGALVLLTFKPSEFSTLSLQARRVRGQDGADRDAAFFKWTFNIGPHGTDPY